MKEMNFVEGDRTLRNIRRRGGCVALSRNESSKGMECSRGVQCYSPARVAVCRLLAIVKKCKVRRRDKVHVKEEEHVEEDVGPTLTPTISHVVRHKIDSSGHPRQEMTFNLAAGLGLLSLIAVSKTELDKTVELRRQMEVFLRSAKEEHEIKGTTPKRSEPEIGYAVSTSMDGLSNLSPYSQDDNAPTLSQQQSGMSFVYDIHSDDHQSEACLDRINNLEAELAAELERLQLDVESGQLSENQEVTEISPTDNANGTASITSGEVIDPKDAATPEHCGVPPLELERRLHEVLEARQEERIKELEAHLESMQKRLQEKEVEVCWWKDTAKLISKQVMVCGE